MSVAENIYAKSPILLQNLFVSIRGWEYRYRRSNDRAIREYLNFLLQSQKWSQEQFHEYQTQSLRNILRIAFESVPYYREMQRQIGCQPEDFKSPEDIRYLPILEKSTLRGNEQAFLNHSFDLGKCTHGFTSGTTGTPINVYESRESFSHRWAFVCRLRTWAGINEPLYPRRAQFTGRNIVPDTQKGEKHIYWRYNYLGNALLFSTTHLTPEAVLYYARKLCGFAPELIDGYPSALLIIARVARRLGIELPRPKAIIVSAETLFPEDREELQNAFGCQVYNQYAATEPSCFWCDCEYGVMHVNPEYGISEIVDADGNPVPPGEEGEIVVTSFLNPVMPLIRYRLGDVAILGPNTLCECGRRMPRIERIVGRVDDILFVPQRGYVGRLDPAFKGLGNIIEAQIIQESLERIRVLLVPDEGYDPAMAQKLVGNLRAKLGGEVTIDIQLVASIPRGPNGKFRSVISNVKHLYPDRM